MSSVETPKAALRALVVDDSSVNLLVAEAMLQDRGLAVDTASSAAEALAKAGSVDYALILQDIRMSGVDGIATARGIRALGGHNRSVPIVALTANTEPGARDVCLAAGMNDYVAKPLEIEILDRVLQRWCGIPLPRKPSPAGNGPVTPPIFVDLATFAQLRAGVTEESFCQLASRFSSDTGHRIVRMRAAAAFGEHALIVREAHTIKSTAALFGARGLMAAAAEVERKAQRREDCAEPIVGLATLADAVGAWLEQELLSASTSPERDGRL